VHAELRIHKIFLFMRSCGASNKLDYMKQGEIKDGFSLLSEILKLFLTIPTNTASCERNFSCLRRLDLP